MRNRIMTLAGLAVVAGLVGLAKAATPSFDCAKAPGRVRQLICHNDDLAALDRTLAQLYASTQTAPSAPPARAQRQAQRTWLMQRNACAKSDDLQACVETAYRQRIAGLQIFLGQMAAKATVGLTCKGPSPGPISAAFYDTNPATVLLSDGTRKAVAFVAPSGSGARYAADGVEYWEHQGQAKVKWRGTDMECAIATPP